MLKKINIFLSPILDQNSNLRNISKQAGVELGQAQFKLHWASL